MAAFCLLWHILVQGFWEGVFHKEWKFIGVNVTSLITGDFAAGAVLISFGVLLGKISPTQVRYRYNMCRKACLSHFLALERHFFTHAFS